MDWPNGRSLHLQPVPRAGGLGVVAGFVAGSVPFGLPPWLASGAVVLMIVSFWDDRFGVSAAKRLLVHIAAAAGAVYVLAPGGPIAVLGSLLLLVWMTNLYNFMDGSDGLAGGMAVIGFAAYAVAALDGGAYGLATASLAVSGAALAFLMVNFPPARQFLGDSGSIPLGFLAGAIGLAGWTEDLWPAWFPVVLFGPFVTDATVTLLRRLAAGESPAAAHRSHYYQRLVLAGWSHRKLALTSYAVMLLCAAFALELKNAPTGLQIAGCGGLLLGVALLILGFEFRQKNVSL